MAKPFDHEYGTSEARKFKMPRLLYSSEPT